MLVFRSAFLLLPLLFLVFIQPAVSQLSRGGVPESFSAALPPDSGPEIEISAPDLETLSMEDRESPVPYRFAVNIPVNVTFSDWPGTTVSRGDITVRRITLVSPGAKAISLYFNRFSIPEGGKLFVYNPGRTQVLGAFTAENNNRFNTFATGLIYGEKVTLEYNSSAGMEDPVIDLTELSYAYRGTGESDQPATGFGSAGPCEVNINCSEGSGWHNQKRGVTRIMVKRGGASLWCTGSLVNNTLNDGKPYVLTADHCGRFSSELDLSQWIFYFNYEGQGCSNPPREPVLHSMTGATKIAHGGSGGNNGSDFFLALISASIPDSFNVYFNGWSRDTIGAPAGVTIHHPEGDIKKISTYQQPLQIARWPGDTKTAHWRVFWSETANGHGTTEPGSSGSPLFDPAGRIVGTLTGGDSSCDTNKLFLPDYYGMFSYHWDKNGTDSTEQLRKWLDPVNANVMSVNGWALSVGNEVSEPRLHIYPNPAVSGISLQLPGTMHGEVGIRIMDLGGRTVLEEQCMTGHGGSLTLQVGRLERGCYFIEARHARKVMSGKFIRL